MEPRIEALSALLALNTDLVLNCCSDFSQLMAPTTDRFPIPGGTAHAMLTFLAQHESYHIGQMAYLRRWLGHEAMSYHRGERLEV